MKKIICKVEYDTQNATLIKQAVYGVFGDAAGYEERLYQTAGGKYFLYVNGGAHSPFPKENILRLSPAKADEWLKKNG